MNPLFHQEITTVIERCFGSIGSLEKVKESAAVKMVLTIRKVAQTASYVLYDAASNEVGFRLGKLKESSPLDLCENYAALLMESRVLNECSDFQITMEDSPFGINMAITALDPLK